MKLAIESLSKDLSDKFEVSQLDITYLGIKFEVDNEDFIRSCIETSIEFHKLGIKPCLFSSLVINL